MSLPGDLCIHVDIEKCIGEISCIHECIDEFVREMFCIHGVPSALNARVLLFQLFVLAKFLGFLNPHSHEKSQLLPDPHDVTLTDNQLCIHDK